jgi:hypothetical protein
VGGHIETFPGVDCQLGMQGTDMQDVGGLDWTSALASQRWLLDTDLPPLVWRVTFGSIAA